MCFSLTRKVSVAKKENKIETIVFFNFSSYSYSLSICTFSVIYELLQGLGEVVFAQLPDDPNPAASEDILGQGLVTQPRFSPPEIGKSLQELDPAKQAGG